MRNVFIFCLTALAILFLTRAGNSTARTLRHLVPHKDNTCAQDTGFVAKYSKILGVSLDSCCNHKLIAAVSGWLKVPYMAGGNTKRGTDCSGFVSSIYKEVYGLNLSHSGISMFRQMKQLVKRDEKNELLLIPELDKKNR